MEFWGKTTDDAIKTGLDQMNKTKAEVQIKVISEGRKGFFGFFSKKAVVDIVAKVPEKATVTKEEATAKKESALEKKGDDGEGVLRELGYYLADITQKMGITTTIDVMVERRVVTYNFATKQEGTLIGRHGKTLNALQLLAQDILDRKSKRKMQVVLDVTDYRARRKETLQFLAHKVARDAILQNSRQRLDPMPAFERKIIHATLAKNTQVKTYSSGDEPRRFVVVEPAYGRSITKD